MLLNAVGGRLKAAAGDVSPQLMPQRHKQLQVPCYLLRQRLLIIKYHRRPASRPALTRTTGTMYLHAYQDSRQLINCTLDMHANTPATNDENIIHDKNEFTWSFAASISPAITHCAYQRVSAQMCCSQGLQESTWGALSTGSLCATLISGSDGSSRSLEGAGASGVRMRGDATGGDLTRAHKPCHPELLPQHRGRGSQAAESR
jgi:hypothetical protein